MLFVKEINTSDLGQGEALILQITEHYAKQCLKQAEELVESSQNFDARQAALCNQSQKVISAMNQLSQLRQQRRKQSRNMGS